ncbi:hypothetical protein L1987_65321 [Smallanthus sonchifolius]|uniref:Uncharacterized protein n=1 Tax=Smallanthus sonchifolius TaxID=185202 RepID=A0ACB9BU57_9ASTR|nr:hypothetical protein L1987_65321 [Smallanthus sonchifolius]
MAYFKSSQCSTSSMPSGKWKYDAFLSFRGEDTRYNFVDHLYAALVQRGLCVFKDDEELKRGKAISPELLKAIEGSRFAVVVFSKNYANSSWCLIELAKIMEWHNRMGQKVLPVFYHVDPSDIRRQKNDVAIFFQQHKKKLRKEMDSVKKLRKEMDTVKKWRKALTAAANISGLHISEKFKEGESTYINKIVQDILGDIQPCDMEKNLVGINSHMDALNSLLGKKENVEDPDDGANMIRRRFAHKKVLIVLDDVDNGMHDLTQEMGWKIVRDSFPNSRLWQLEDIHDYINKNRKLKAIEAIVVSDKQYDDDVYEEKVGFSANVFERMKNLRLLIIRGKFTSSKPTFLPEDLRWLCWNQYPFSYLQVEHLSKLIGLELVRGSIKQFWDGQKIMPNLKFIKLQQLDCLTTFPDVSGAPNIEKLFLYGCTNLVEVHESLGSHTRLVKLYIIGCERLKRLPSRIQMKSLRFLKVNKCSSLERLPDVSPCMKNLSRINLENCFSIEELPASLGYLSSLDYLNLRRCTNLSNINLPKSINLHTLTNSRSLRTLNLSWRQMESEDFPNLHVFSSLENLDLTGNNKLIRLPESISHLSRLKSLKVNECHQLQTLHALPSRIQVLEANGCCSLEEIIDLSKEYDQWYYISFINCHKLLKDEDNQRYMDKMLQQSFLKRCAVVDCPLTIAIPGKKIPSWFKEEQAGYKITLMIPPKCNTQIIGLAICGVFHGEWRGTHDYRPYISFTFKKNGISITQKEVDCVNASAAAGENGNTWISYRPFSSFRRKDWSGGSLLISISVAGGAKAVKCATCLVYKEDVESTRQIRTCISYKTSTKKMWKAKPTTF